MDVRWGVFYTTLLVCILTNQCGAKRNRQGKRLTRMERRLRRKSNSIAYESRYNHNFRTDQDIVHYLKLYGEDAMVWRCKNAVQPFYDGNPLPLIELNCETLGVLKSVDWFYNGVKLPSEPNEHTKQTIVPHFARGQYFSRWLDFKLKLYNATARDSGIYTFTAHSKIGTKLQHQIYVDISKKTKKGKSKYLRSRKLKRRDYMRYYTFHQRHNDDGRGTARTSMVRTGRNSYYMVR